MHTRVLGYHTYTIANVPYERFMLQPGEPSVGFGALNDKFAHALGTGGRHGNHSVADAAGGAAVGAMAERHYDRAHAGAPRVTRRTRLALGSRRNMPGPEDNNDVSDL